MAKKHSKKVNMLNLILTIVVIALAVLTICTMFMPVFTSKATILGSTSVSHIKGADVITATFNGQTSSNFSAGANALISLKGAEDAGFVTGLFCWLYFLAVILSCAVIVFALLKLFGFKLKLVNAILGIVLVLLAVVAFICSFVVAGKFGSVSISGFVTGKTVASAGVYLLLMTLACGGLHTYLAKK